MFPRLRFQDAGATADELDRLEADFDLLPDETRQRYAETWAGLARDDLIEWLELWRHRLGTEEPEEEPAAAPASSTSTGKTASPTSAPPDTSADSDASEVAGAQGQSGK